MKVSKKRCNKCGGYISWDKYPNPKWPIHVDVKGNKIGDGSCPQFKPQYVLYQSTKTSITKTRSRINPRKVKSISPYIIVGLIVAILVPVGIVSGIYQLKINSINPDYPDNPDDPDDPEIPNWEIDGQGTVTYIVDGDTYDVSTIGRIRLADIDCPDQGDPGYQEAKNYLSSLINGELVYLDIDDIYETDVYGRTVAVTYVRYNSTHLLNVNKDLLVQGFATIWNFDNEFNPYTWSLYVYYQ